MRKLILSLASVLLFLLLWQFLSYFFSPLLLPSPLLVGKEFPFLFFSGEFLLDLAMTIGRVLASFFLALVIGIPLGILLGYYQKLYSALEFLVDFGRSIPPPMLFPLFMLFLGIGEWSKILPAAFAGSFYVLINTMYGVRNVKKLRLDWAKTLGLSKFQLIKKIILPEALPHIFTGVRITLMVSLILILVFEMFVGTHYGLGQRVSDAHMMYEIPRMYALILVSGMIGYLMNQLFLIYERRKTHWWGR